MKQLCTVLTIFKESNICPLGKELLYSVSNKNISSLIFFDNAAIYLRYVSIIQVLQVFNVNKALFVFDEQHVQHVFRILNMKTDILAKYKQFML